MREIDAYARQRPLLLRPCSQLYLLLDVDRCMRGIPVYTPHAYTVQAIGACYR